MVNLSKKAILEIMRETGPGPYTPESINKTHEIITELLQKIGKTSRELAQNAGKKRVTENEIKLATNFLIKN